MTAYADADVAAAVTRGLSAARDRPHPDDGERMPEKYARLSRDFRAGAWRHLDENDLPQASNKAWGMVAETVKAVGAQHGGVIHTHRAIMRVLEELSALTAQSGDAELARWINNAFNNARYLHTNFYEDEASSDRVESGLRLCEQLSGRLYQLFWPAGAAAEEWDDLQ